MPSPAFPFVFLLRHTSTRTTFFRYCQFPKTTVVDYDMANNNVSSAELEMTVNMLIQIDKLVQLLESPVFTCTFLPTDKFEVFRAHGF